MTVRSDTLDLLSNFSHLLAHQSVGGRTRLGQIPKDVFVTILAGLGIGGGWYSFANSSDLTSAEALAFPNGTEVRVYGGTKGIYRKNGAPGAGSYTKIADLPNYDSLIDVQLVLDGLTKAKVIHLRTATAAQNEEDDTVYTFTSDELSANPDQYGRFYIGVFPSTNPTGSPRIQMANTAGLIGPARTIRVADDRNPKPNSIPVGPVLFAGRPGNYDLISAGGALGSGSVGDVDGLEELVLALSDYFASQDKLDEVVSQFETAIADVADVASRMRGAVVAATAAFHPDRPGEVGWLSTSTAGDFGAALATLVPEAWVDALPNHGAVVVLDGATIVSPATSVVGRRPDRFPLKSGQSYRLDATLFRIDQGQNPGGDVVRVTVRFFDYEQVFISAANVFNQTMATGEAQELVRTLAWSSGGGATVIPAGALYADLVVEAFGTTPKTAVARIDLTKSA